MIMGISSLTMILAIIMYVQLRKAAKEKAISRLCLKHAMVVSARDNFDNTVLILDDIQKKLLFVNHSAKSKEVKLISLYEVLSCKLYGELPGQNEFQAVGLFFQLKRSNESIRLQFSNINDGAIYIANAYRLAQKWSELISNSIPK